MTNEMGFVLSAAGILGGGTGIAAIIVAITSRRKTKADALKVIEDAAASQVVRMREEAERWRTECLDLRSDNTILRSDIDAIKGRVDENEACQTTLKRQIAQLENEKQGLIEKVESLKKRVDELEAENRKLKDKTKNDR